MEKSYQNEMFIVVDLLNWKIFIALTRVLYVQEMWHVLNKLQIPTFPNKYQIKAQKGGSWSVPTIL